MMLRVVERLREIHGRVTMCDEPASADDRITVSFLAGFSEGVAYALGVKDFDPNDPFKENPGESPGAGDR